MNGGSDPIRRRSLGDLVRNARRDAGLNQRELAEKCGVTAMYVSQIEGGDRKPSVKVCEALSAHLPLDREVLLRARVPRDIERLYDQPREEGLSVPSDRLKRVLAMLDQLTPTQQETTIKTLETLVEAFDSRARSA